MKPQTEHGSDTRRSSSLWKHKTANEIIYDLQRASIYIIIQEKGEINCDSLSFSFYLPEKNTKGKD